MYWNQVIRARMKWISEVKDIPITLLLFTNRLSLPQAFFRISHPYIPRKVFALFDMSYRPIRRLKLVSLDLKYLLPKGSHRICFLTTSIESYAQAESSKNVNFTLAWTSLSAQGHSARTSQYLCFAEYGFSQGKTLSTGRKTTTLKT